MNSCNECKWCLLEDYGYSNYTVEGTEASCLLQLNPSLPADHRWGEASQLKYAAECPRFAAGDPVHVDVDHENGSLLNYVDDAEVRELVEKQVMWESLSDK